MNKERLTEKKAETTPSGGVLVGKREGQTIIHNEGTLSGYLVGRTHAKGGIKAVNKSTGQPLEMQGGEVVITAPAVSDNTKREFEGRMMTNREILSEINQRGGGVSFAYGGDIPTEMHFGGNSYKYGGKTLSDHEIAYEISKCGCDHESFNEGGKIDPMPSSVKKKIYTADGERKITPVAISILTNYVNALPQTKELNTDSKGNYTKERQELHQKIINDFKDELICIQKDEPIAILMGGSPASGKSTFLKKYAPYLLKEEILKVDADEIRSMLPEYNGYNATQTHLETKDIVNTLLSDKTIGIPCKYDIIYDGTMNNTKSYLPLISLLKSLGYKIFIVYVDKVPEEVVKKRALERYKKSGRFVPMEIIDDFFSKGKTALEELKSKADGYMIIDGSNGDYNVLEKKGIRLPKTRAYSKLGQPISKLEKIANGGSLSKGMSLKQIAKIHGVTLLELNRQVKMGLDAESEHTPNVTEQMKIVKDHLYENPNYYTLLKEAGLEKGGKVDSFLNYYLEELKDFLKNQNDINLKDDYTFSYKGEKFTIEPVIVSDTNAIKEASFIIYDLDNEIVGSIEFNPKNEKELIANSQFFEWNSINFEWNSINFEDGGSLVRDSKNGNSTSRDLNNYNDLMDVQADGAVGGDIGLFVNGGRLGTSGLPLVDYVQIINGGSYLNNLKNNDKFYDFQSLKKRVAEEYKLLPSTPVYRGYIEVQAYDTEGNQLVAPNTYISDMKNTVKNFNPYTGKPSDLEKSFAKSRPINFKKYDWSEWSSGKKSVPSTQASGTFNLVTGLYISYTNPTNNSLSSFTVDNASEFLYTLINLYKNSIKNIDYKLIINGKVLDFSVYGLVLTDDPQDNWRTIDFRMNPNVTTVDDVAYRLKEQYSGLDLSNFLVSFGLNAIGQPNGASTVQTTANTTSKVEIPDFDIDFDKRVKSLPAPILGLLMFRAIEQGIDIDDSTLERKVGTIQNKRDGKIFAFAKAEEGGEFWAYIANGNFKEFKKLYGKYGEKVKDIVGTPATSTSTTSKTLSRVDLEQVKIKINSDLDLALKVVEVLESKGFTDTEAIRRRINRKDNKFGIVTNDGVYVGWFDDEADFNASPKKEIFLSDLGINTATKATQQQNNSIPNIKFSFDLKQTKIWIGDNPELSRRVQERAMELGFDWWSGDKKPRNLEMQSLFFDNNEKITGIDTRESFDSFYDYKEIFASDFFGSATKATQQQNNSIPNIKFSFDLKQTKIWIGDNPELSRRVQERAMELGFDWWSGDKKPRNLEMQSLIFSDNEKITGVDIRESFDSFNDHKEIFESDLNQDKKISNEYVADDSVLRRNNILGSASLQKDRDDLDALVKLLPSFNQSKFAVEKATILKEMARLQKKLDYKGYIISNEQVSKGSDLFTPQGLLNYYYTQATQNPTAELEPPCELPTPNGGKSKLPLGAYLNVRSSQFKKWFGDWEKAYETDNYVNCSKMIDEETKEPKIFYHGVRKFIPSFGQMSNMGAGVVRPYGSFEPPNFPASYFANNESYANFYGGIAENMPKPSDTYKPFIYKVFLSIKNPIVLLPLDFEVSYRDLIDYILVAYGVRLNPNNVLLGQLGNDMDKKHPMWIYIRRDIGLIETLKDYGYDALIQQGDIPVFDTNGQPISDRSKYIKDIEYLSFYPNQVKSATVKKSFYFNFFNDIRFKKGGYVRI